MDLTVAGEVSLRSAPHLEQLPKTLTSGNYRQVRAILVLRGLPKFDLNSARRRRGANRSRIFSPQKNLEYFLRGRPRGDSKDEPIGVHAPHHVCQADADICKTSWRRSKVSRCGLACATDPCGCSARNAGQEGFREDATPPRCRRSVAGAAQSLLKRLLAEKRCSPDPLQKKGPASNGHFSAHARAANNLTRTTPVLIPKGIPLDAAKTAARSFVVSYLRERIPKILTFRLTQSSNRRGFPTWMHKKRSAEGPEKPHL